MSVLAQTIKHLAPELPDYKAQYRAIQLEPVALSGERLTVGIMAKSSQGETCVIQTLSNKTIRCMYGKKHLQIINLIALILDSAEQHLQAKGELHKWHPPLTGVFLPDIQTTYSNKGMDGVLLQAITHHASLYCGDIINKALAEWQEQKEEPQAEPEERLITRVKTLVIKRNEQLKNNWNKAIHTQKGTLIHIDYLGLRYNANFSNFDVQQIKLAYRFAKAKLYDLELLRNKRAKELLDSQQRFDLLVFISETANNEQQDLLSNIIHAADEQQLCVITETSPLKLAERILKQEAA